MKAYLKSGVPVLLVKVIAEMPIVTTFSEKIGLEFVNDPENNTPEFIVVYKDMHWIAQKENFEIK